MPITPSAITLSILAASPDLQGTVWRSVAAAVGIGVAAWAQIPSNLAMQGITAGAAGSGVVTGKFSVVPVPLPVPASMAAAGLVGVNAASVGRGVGIGVANAFNASATYVGASVGVGTGTDVSKVSLSNGPSLVLALSAACASVGLTGVNITRLCAGMGPGIVALLLTGTGVGVVAGPVGPAPGAGTSISRIL